MICIADLEGTLTTGSVHDALQRYRQAMRQAASPVELGEWIVEHELWPKRTPLVELLGQRNAEQVRLIIYASSVTEVLEAFSRRLRAEPLSLQGSTPEQRVQETRVDGRRKAQQVRRYLHGARVDYVFTDSMDDLPVLDLAVRPCAVNPDQQLLNHAQSRAWRILNFAQAGSSVHGLIL